MTPELYARLEVDPLASHAGIVAAYRRLAQRVHPDTHPDDPDAPRRFREITEAYVILGDTARRAAYDEVWRASLRVPERRSEPRPVARQPLIVDLGPLPVRQQPAPGWLANGSGTGDPWRASGGDPFGGLTRLLEAMLRDVWSR